MGMNFADFFQTPYGMWLLVAEIVVCGIIPAIILLTPQAREDEVLLIVACVLNCTGIIINRFVFTVQNLALPVLPFEQVQIYVPTWQEWAPTVALLAYGALLLSLSYRYLPMFPRERELNPID
jgi:molybdopterin-containing oxidoreductase family membrane subunit